MQKDFLLSLLKACRKEQIHTAVDTAGHVPGAWFDEVIPYTDLFLYDMKAADPDIHKRLTGEDNRLILSNLKKLSDAGCRIIIRIPFVSSRNKGEIPGIAQILRDMKTEKVELLPYHKLGLSKYEALGIDNQCRDEETPAEEDVSAALRILRDAGLNAVRS